MTNASLYVVLSTLVGLAGCKSTCEEYCDAMYERGCRWTFLGSVSACVAGCESEEDAFEDMHCGSEYDDWAECSTGRSCSRTRRWSKVPLCSGHRSVWLSPRCA